MPGLLGKKIGMTSVLSSKVLMKATNWETK